MSHAASPRVVVNKPVGNETGSHPPTDESGESESEGMASLHLDALLEQIGSKLLLNSQKSRSTRAWGGRLELSGCRAVPRSCSGSTCRTISTVQMYKTCRKTEQSTTTLS